MSYFLEKKACDDLRALRNACPIIQYAVNDNLFNNIGDVKGKDVLEIGCGDGTNLALLSDQKPKSLTGIDISPTMVEIASSKKMAGIDFKVSNAATMGKIGDFDVCFAYFVLCYIETEEDLVSCFRNVYDNLRPGGRFICADFNQTSSDWYDTSLKFDRMFRIEEETSSGRLVQAKWRLDDICLTPLLHHYNKSVYDAIFSKVLFRSVKWEKLTPNEAGLAKFGTKFWEDYLAKPEYELIIADK